MTRDEAGGAPREPPLGGKRLVVVVHGLGDGGPGDAVRSLARSIATATGRDRAPVEETLWLTEGPGRQIEDFPCHVERLREEGGETVLVEAYWADLSRLGHGALDILLGFFRTLFGLHQVAARHAAEPDRRPDSASEPAAVVFQKLCLLIAYLIRGPAAAGALLFFTSWAIGSSVVALGDESVLEHQSGWVLGIIVANGLIGLATGAAGILRRRGGPHGAFFFWLAVIGASNLAFAVAISVDPRVTSVFWGEEAALAGSWEFSLTMNNRILNIGSYLVVLAAVPWLVARLRATRSHRPGLDVAQALNMATLLLWVLLFQAALILFVRQLPEEDLVPQAEEAFGAVASAMVLYWSLLVVVGGAALVTLVRQRRWAKTARAESYEPSRPAPRLLLAGGIVYTLIAMPLVLFLAAVAGLLQPLFESLEGASRVMVPAVALIAVVVAYLSDRVRSVLDFLLDLVSHFERERSAEDGGPTFARRLRIRARFEIVLETLVRRETPDRVTVLAHSQGTIVALEALAQEKAKALLEPLTRCDLVTMASPFHHFYQHYFPNDYPPLSDPRWDGLRQRVVRWLNIFRIDDPVGTGIEPGGEWPENLPVDPGGHSDYWRDRQVLRILQDTQLV